jgi:hypothetical protein
MDLKSSIALPFEYRKKFDATRKYYFETIVSENRNNYPWGYSSWYTSNWSYYMKELLMFYSKYPLLMFHDAAYWDMFNKVTAIESMAPYLWYKSYSFVKTIQKYATKVRRLYVSDTCLVLSRTPLPGVLCREVIGYLFGDMDLLFPAPKKEVLRIHRSLRAQAAGKKRKGK